MKKVLEKIALLLQINLIKLIQSQPSQDNLNGLKIKINKSFLLDENDKLIEEQKKILKQMEIEILSLSNRNYYDEYEEKISSFKKTIDLNMKKLNDLYSKKILKQFFYE